MEKNYFVTITGTKFYYGMKPFEIGRIIKLVKEPDNEHDSEAIRAELPFIGKIGYVSNSTHTVVKGTFSGGRVYDLFPEESFAQVLFVTNESVICLLLLEEEENKEAEIKEEIVNGEVTHTRAIYEKGKMGFHI
ncbi:MAG: HIRAN domain-containing protein [Sedimentibacter sp.]